MLTTQSLSITPIRISGLDYAHQALAVQLFQRLKMRLVRHNQRDRACMGFQKLLITNALHIMLGKVNAQWLETRTDG